MRKERLETVESSFRDWTELRNARISRGDLRPDAREAEAFSRFATTLEILDEGERAHWDRLRQQIERSARLPLCRCGHPEAYHVDERCFAMIGCSTECACTAMKMPGPATPDLHSDDPPEWLAPGG